jgi:high-affinity nickel-transport protein
MVGASGWALVKPIRKLHYNMTITLISVIVALVVAGVEAIDLFRDQLGLTGGIWELVGSSNEHLGP